jgi:hypothetical protein
LVFNCPNCYSAAMNLGFSESGWASRNPGTQIFVKPAE